MGFVILDVRERWSGGSVSAYYLGVVVMATLFVYQQYLAKDRSREGCFKAFLNNNWAGFAVFTGLIVDLYI